MQLPFDIGVAAPGMIGLLAGRDIALGHEVDNLLPDRLIDIPHKYAEGLVLRAVSDDPLRCSGSRPSGTRYER